ncbi:hypothetical protein [Reyranella sp.]|uniref:hypothetical protein n=1 Tax=Reyranella sp. TaxID=1929291 RepID=UPI003BA9CF0B
MSVAKKRVATKAKPKAVKTTALSLRERQTLNAAYRQSGVKAGDRSLYGVGDQTFDTLVERGLLEQMAHPETGRLMYRTTAPGKAALQAPPAPEPAKAPAKAVARKATPAAKPAVAKVAKPKKRA